MAPTVSWTSLIFLPLLMLLAGAVLLVIGLRGRRVGDHPVCRRCGFDLFGNPAAARCPECGADLGVSGAVRTGHLRRRRGALHDPDEGDDVLRRRSRPPCATRSRWPAP